MKKETILLVDDDQSMLSMLAKSLEESYQVLVVTNGMEAVYVYEQHREAIVALVTDVEMPRLDGTALAEWVRHINPTLPIILMSGRVAGERISRLLQRPGIAFLAKPFMPTKIEELLNSLGAVSASALIRDSSINSGKAFDTNFLTRYPDGCLECWRSQVAARAPARSHCHPTAQPTTEDPSRRRSDDRPSRRTVNDRRYNRTYTRTAASNGLKTR